MFSNGPSPRHGLPADPLTSQDAPGLARQMYVSERMPGPPVVLTAKQAEVVGLVARGYTNKEIAARQRVSLRAVTAQLTRLMRKFDVPNRAGLIAAVMSAAGVGLPRGASPAGGLGAQIQIIPGDPAAVYEGAPFMVAVTLGPRHVYSFVNRLAAQVAGRPADSLVGRAVREVYPDLDPQFGAALDQVYSSGVPWSAGDAVVRWTHLDGTSREARANLMFQPLRDAEGRVVGLLHIGAEAAEP
jgi:DNA-binding CsgD family transcriptional regulator